MSYTAFDDFVAWCRFRAAISHIKPGSRVCDIGCGLNAAFLQHANSRVQFGVGVDYQTMNPSRTAVVQCDITRSIPLHSEKFDHVVMLAVLEHLENPRSILEDVFRILAPGGSLIMTWPQPVVDPILDVLHRIGLVSHEMESDLHQARIPVADLTAMLKNIGFQNFTHKRFEFGLNNLLVSHKG